MSVFALYTYNFKRGLKYQSPFSQPSLRATSPSFSYMGQLGLCVTQTDRSWGHSDCPSLGHYERKTWGNELGQETEILVSIRTHCSYLIRSFQNPFFFQSLFSNQLSKGEKVSISGWSQSLLPTLSDLVSPGQELCRRKGCRFLMDTDAERKILPGQWQWLD